MPTITTTNLTQIGNNNTDGVVIMGATDAAGNPTKVAFFGGTPQPQIMQGSLAGALGTLTIYTTSQSPAAVTANTTSEVSMTVTGVGATDMVVALIKPTSQAGLAVGDARVSATNTVKATFGNLTGSTITPTTTESYVVVTASAALQFPAVTLSPASVAASTTVEQMFTVQGVTAGMVMAVSKPTSQAGLLVTGCRAVSANTVAVEFMNVTTATVITPTPAEAYLFWGAQGLRVAPSMLNLAVSLAPVSVAANTTAEQTFTVPGLIAASSVQVNKPSVTTGLALVGARVSALNTLALNYANTTAAAITPPTEVYEIGYFPTVVAAAGSSVIQQAQQGVAAADVLARHNLVSAEVAL